MADENYPAVEALINWRGLDPHDTYHEVKSGYTYRITTIPPGQLHPEDKEAWDIIVRQVKSTEGGGRTVRIVFQIASPRGPHDRLRVGMKIGLAHFREPGWVGEILDLDLKPLLASSWKTPGL